MKYSGMGTNEAFASYVSSSLNELPRNKQKLGHQKIQQILNDLEEDDE
jgi:hypothetical protein